MTRLLVLGYTLPLYIPHENTVAPRAFNLRTAQLTEALLEANHDVVVCARLHAGETFNPINGCKISGLTYVIAGCSYRDFVTTSVELYKKHKPDAVICVGQMAALVLEKIMPGVPVWIDLYGDPITDLQMELCVRGKNRGLITHLWIDRLVLRRGDVFSACSNPQRFVMLGRLAALHRLEYRTCEHEFVHALLPAMPARLAGDEASKGKQPFFRDDYFQVIWYGGYNAWVDELTLFEGLTLAMAKNPAIHFLSIGEGIADPQRYLDFKKNIQASPYRDRFTLLGWQPFGEISRLCKESQLGISILRNIYETQTGAPTRLVEMLSLGLPVLSVGCDLSDWVASIGAGITVGFKDPQTIAQAIVDLSYDPMRWQKMADKSQEITRFELTPAETCRPLLAWAAQPTLAPDRLFELSDWLEDQMHWMIETLYFRLFNSFR